MPCQVKSFRASRMRETRPSGLMRAEAAATLPLRYSTALARNPFADNLSQRICSLLMVKKPLAR
jgi:hypothetical protein